MLPAPSPPPVPTTPPPDGFQLADWSSWSAPQAAAFALCVFLAFEALGWAPELLAPWAAAAARIPPRGAHHDALDDTDVAFLAFNRLAAVPFSYHLLRALCTHPGVRWGWAGATPLNAALALPLLFLVYDLGYGLFHRALHHRSVYAAVHKHHHRQHAPSRGNVDAVNVHPLEFLVGEYLHLAAVVALAWALPGGVHVAAAAAFVVLGGLGASLNHTRLDVRVPRAAAGEGGGGWLYDVRAHDVHHRLPRSNYGQYTMAWDRLFGTYRPYDGPGAAAPPRKGKAGGD